MNLLMKLSLSLFLFSSFWIGLRGNHWQWRIGSFVSSGAITLVADGGGGSGGGGGGGAPILEENEEVKEKEEESEDDMGFSLFD